MKLDRGLAQCDLSSCGVAFRRKPAEIDDAEHNFCSRDHYWLWSRGGPARTARCALPGCGREFPVSPSRLENWTHRFCSREHRFEWQRRGRSNTATCALGSCGKEIRRNPGELGRSLRHFCSQDHYHEFQRGRRSPTRVARPSVIGSGRRRASGRRMLRILSLSEQPSARKIAEQEKLHPDTVRRVRRDYVHARPLTRYALERQHVVPRQTRPSLMEAVLAFCYEARIQSLSKFANRAEMGITTLHAAINRGSATRATLEKMARVMNRSVEELVDLSRPSRRPSPRKVASTIFNVELREGRRPDVEVIVRRVVDILPGANEDSIRRYLDGRQRKARGPGAPRLFTEEEAMEVWRLRHQTPPMPWAKIGRRIGWPVVKNAKGCPTDCRRARNAYAFAEKLLAHV